MRPALPAAGVWRDRPGKAGTWGFSKPAGGFPSSASELKLVRSGRTCEDTCGSLSGVCMWVSERGHHWKTLLFWFRTVNVSVPKKTRNNGTLYAYIFLHHAGVLPWHDGKQVHLVSPLTTYMVPKPEEVHLLTGESAAQVSA